MVYIYVSFESSEISAHENDIAYGKEHMVIVGLKRYVAKHYSGMSLVSRRMILQSLRERIVGFLSMKGNVCVAF